MKIASKLEQARDCLKEGEREEARKVLDELIEFTEEVKDQLPEKKAELFKTQLSMIRTDTLLGTTKPINKLEEMIEGFKSLDSSKSHKIDHELGDDTEKIEADQIQSPGNAHLEDEIERIQSQLMDLEGRVGDLEES